MAAIASPEGATVSSPGREPWGLLEAVRHSSPRARPPGCHGLYPTREPKTWAIVHGLSTTRGTQQRLYHRGRPSDQSKKTETNGLAQGASPGAFSKPCAIPPLAAGRADGPPGRDGGSVVYRVCFYVNCIQGLVSMDIDGRPSGATRNLPTTIPWPIRA